MFEEIITKEQEAHNKKVAKEVEALLAEAKEKKIEVSSAYNNPESIRALIDRVEASRPKVVKK